jgi:uncharacterized protein involved in type VI secretion and phage assembly
VIAIGHRDPFAIEGSGNQRGLTAGERFSDRFMRLHSDLNMNRKLVISDLIPPI